MSSHFCRRVSGWLFPTRIRILGGRRAVKSCLDIVGYFSTLFNTQLEFRICGLAGNTSSPQPSAAPSCLAANAKLPRGLHMRTESC
ncbi:hypothetical protein AMECASPLE_005502 [Ameca splendens]|uniref:Uncharacterized protein n=1 Tax=Ameca splendens TaxID=208324 RepID=A0ABV0YA66_9TELE